MLLYHGTTEDVATKIKKLGLIPHRSTAYNVMYTDGAKLRDMVGEDRETIYLTPDASHAAKYAKFRADYNKADNKTAIYFGKDGMPQWKLGESCNCKPIPVVIAFDLPNTMIDKLETDIQDFDAYVCTCTIPPQYIKQIIPIGKVN